MLFAWPNMDCLCHFWKVHRVQERPALQLPSFLNGFKKKAPWVDVMHHIISSHISYMISYHVISYDYDYRILSYHIWYHIIISYPFISNVAKFLRTGSRLQKWSNIIKAPQHSFVWNNNPWQQSLIQRIFKTFSPQVESFAQPSHMWQPNVWWTRCTLCQWCICNGQATEGIDSEHLTVRREFSRCKEFPKITRNPSIHRNRTALKVTFLGQSCKNNFKLLELW